MTLKPSLVPLVPILGEEAVERAWDFVHAHVSPQEGKALFPIIDFVSSSGIPERISHVFGGVTRSPAYKACTSNAAYRTNRVRTANLRRLTLNQAAHFGSTGSMLGYGRSEWPGARSHIFKAALIKDGDATPVETLRINDGNELAGLVARYLRRLRDAGHAVPHYSMDTSSDFVEAVLLSAIHDPADWTGRVSRTWVPHHGINPTFPPLADRVGIAQAVTYDRRTPGQGGFTWMKCQEHWLVGFGPSAADRYYLHRSLLRPARDGQSTAFIEEMLRHRAAQLDVLEDPLAGFVPERMLIHPSKQASFDHIIARILFAWQLPRWSAPRHGDGPESVRPRIDNPPARRARKAS